MTGRKAYPNGGQAAASARYRARNQPLNPKLWWANNVLAGAKRRAQKLGVPFDLDRDFIISIAPPVCPVLGIELNYAGGEGGGPRPNTPSLDRSKPEKGYVEGNITVMSMRANRIKHDGSPEEVAKVAAWMSAVISGENNVSL